MARPRRKQILFTKATQFDEKYEGPYIRHLRAQRKSINTILDYHNTFNHFRRVMADKNLRDYTIGDITEFLAIMAGEEMELNGIAPRPKKRREPKTIFNFKVALSSLWTWATDNSYADDHIVRAIPNPKVHQKPIEPLEDAEVAALIRATYETRPWRNNPLTTTRRATGERDKALVMLLADTAARISEAVDLRLEDVALSPRGGKIHIIDGKNNKDRWVDFGRRTAQVMQDWLDVHEQIAPDSPWLFISLRGRYTGIKCNPQPIGKMIKRLGKKAGIQRVVTPHLLRTTAACTLAEHVSVWKLMQILGHSNVETTYRYVRAARLKKEVTTSPMDNLRL